MHTQREAEGDREGERHTQRQRKSEERKCTERERGRGRERESKSKGKKCTERERGVDNTLLHKDTEGGGIGNGVEADKRERGEER